MTMLYHISLFFFISLAYGLNNVTLATDGDWRSSCAPQNCSCYYGDLSKKVRVAHCDASENSTIPRGLSPMVTELRMSGIPLGSLPANAFSSVGLNGLETIDLQSCDIETVDKDAFRNLSNLTTLRLSHNRIQTLHPETFHWTPSISVLDMDNNPIEVLEDGLFTESPNLSAVSFPSCRISRIGNGAFGQASNLEVLDLTGNELKYLNLSIIESMPNLRTIFLWPNPWRCDCNLKPFLDWTVLRKREARERIHAECSEPGRFQGMSWDAVKSDELTC